VAIEPTQRPFSVADYYRMAEAGVIGPDERLELIEGEIIRMNPIGRPHANCVNRLTRLLVTGLGERATVQIQNPVRLGDLSEVQPDVSVLRSSWDERAHPGPADVVLLVEVADSSLRFDRDVKLPLYARAGIAEVWLVDLAGQAVEVYRHPDPTTGYGPPTRLAAGDTAVVPGFPDVAFEVTEILGEP
jgi:Uma2 family endonuclease